MIILFAISLFFSLDPPNSSTYGVQSGESCCRLDHINNDTEGGRASRWSNWADLIVSVAL